MSWHVYILECLNGNLYVGATSNLQARFDVHLSGKGSKSVRMAGGPLRFVYSTPAPARGPAYSLEHIIKCLRRSERQLLVIANHQGPALTSFLIDHGLMDDCK